MRRLGYVSVRAALVCASALCPVAVAAQQASPDAAAVPAGSSTVQEIVVTAQKRSQSINAVGLSITAATSEALKQRGIADTAGLVKLVPGFTFAPSPYATPVYTLRGVGVYDNGYASSPAVAVYVDQAPLPYPVLQSGATLDLERVEVLKGPQGTLFGQNSTGGAINYIAAKPTDRLAAGADVSVQNWGEVDASGFVSGPVTDTLKARLALRTVEGGAWQYSTTRPGDKLGDARQIYGRVILDWKPTDRLSVELNLNADRDGSDTQAGQLSYNQINIVGAPTARDPFAIVDPVRFNALTNPASPGYNSSFLGRQALLFGRLSGSEGAVQQAGTTAYLSEPIVGNSPRAADWTADQPERLKSTVYQAALRADYVLSDDIKLTSITSLARFNGNTFVDVDATAAPALDFHEFGNLKVFDQEVRAAWDSTRFHGVVGATYDHANGYESYSPNISELSLNEVFPGLTLDSYSSFLQQSIQSYSVFGNGEFYLTPAFSITGGVRYTDTSIKANACQRDDNPGYPFNQTFDTLEEVFASLGVKTTPVVFVGPGQCESLTPLPDATPTLTPLRQTLDQDNVSWRVGSTYKFDQGTLIYGTISQGYKAGIFSPIGATLTTQLAPAVQEGLLAYEAGFKAPLFDHLLQLNGSVFYYDYTDKQVRARILDPVFGLLEKLINIPKSEVTGVEAELNARPLPGLALSVSGTYLDSDVNGDTGGFYNQAGYTGNFRGSRLPYTPKLSLVADGQYDWALRGGLGAFAGTTLVYHSSDNATFSTGALPANDFKLPSYVTLDLRLGVQSPDKGWAVYLFARNVTDTYYVTSVFNSSDTIYRYAGMPATYGVTFHVRTW